MGGKFRIDHMTQLFTIWLLACIALRSFSVDAKANGTIDSNHNVTSNSSSHQNGTSNPNKTTSSNVGKFLDQSQNTQQIKKTEISGKILPKDQTCKPEKLTKDTWKKHNLDERLKKHPGGDKMGVTDFAASLNVSNFICGIGGNCHAGQPCYPLGTLDWYILFAIQQWNTHLNIYYDAVEYSISMVQTSMNALIASLFPASDTTAIRNMKSDMGIQASLTLVTGTVLMDVMMFFGLAGGAWSVFFNQLNFWMGAGMGYLAFSIKEPPGPLKDGFDQWANLAFYLTNYKEAIQQKVSDESKKRLAAGISTKEGIYEILKGGEYFEPAKTAPLPQIEASLKKITLALSINMLLNQINAFITVGQNKKSCRDKGKNGAWGSPHTLSWCDHYGGTMHNIIVAKGGETFNEINNANSIEESFDFSTETIVKSSMACQALNKGYRYTPWDKDQGELPKKADDVCVFNLPVCYLKDRVAKKIKRKTRTVEACRKYGGLPI